MFTHQAIPYEKESFDTDEGNSRFGVPRRLGRCDDRFGCEVEGNAKDVGVFDMKESLFVEVIGLAAQGAAKQIRGLAGSASDDEDDEQA